MKNSNPVLHLTSCILHLAPCILHLAPCILLLASCILLPCLPVSAQSTRIIFLHHSCGQNLIDEGGVREGFVTRGYEFFDHGYNDEGLRLADGSYAGTDFDVPGDNTDPDGIAEIFSQPLHDPPDNAFSHLMQYDVIAFKSCYPTSNIGSDEQLNEFKGYYLSARDRMDQYPANLFVVVTQPPQVPGSSDGDEARRARALADWLASDEFLGGHPNVFTFDFFDYLAGEDNFLRPEYRYDNYDGHPNEQANREIGPHFVAFIDEAIRGYQSDEPRPTPVVETLVPGTVQPVPVIAPGPAGGAIDDFESPFDWWTEAEDGTIACDLDVATAHGGASSLRMAYDIKYDGWADCGRSFDELQDWSGGLGLTLWVRADAANDWVTLMVFSGDADDSTPFVVTFEVAGDGAWAQQSFTWSDFAKADWVGDAGIVEIDPARMTGYGFSIGAYGEGAAKGTLWVDDMVPLGSASPGATAEPELPAENLGEDDQSGGLCPGAMVLPLGVVGVLLARRRRGL